MQGDTGRGGTEGVGGLHDGEGGVHCLGARQQAGPTSPYISLYLPVSPCISLHLPISPAICRAADHGGVVRARGGRGGLPLA